MSDIDFYRWERWLDATRLGDRQRDDLPAITEWVTENPDYAAKYIAIMQEYLDD